MARKSFTVLADTPGIGTPVHSRNMQLAGLRKWRVEGFSKLLIFYLEGDRGIRIVHLVHAAADCHSLLDVD